ncbi:cadherin-related family member 4 [Rhinatrema bivittatum]|uniref:cadherin-related family member 4 n=1 Tax=Rhinatrema bivittatum TaxID=194408 RepID=UPI00112D3B9E|nr:cadherin-related family member 4 [Rhinatrema bivittatum]
MTLQVSSIMEEALRLLYPLLFLLLMIQPSSGQASLQGLPMTVSLPENSSPGRSVHTFSLQACADPNPSARIITTSPTTSFFNNPSIKYVVANSYSFEITLSSTAAFDTEAVNQYQLTIEIKCYGNALEGKLFVQVTDSDGPQCEKKFASIVGETVKVPEDVPPSSSIYNVVLRRPPKTTVTYEITQPSPTTFTINKQGQVLVPTEGFNYQSGKINFRLEITVKDPAGKSCNGILNIEVLPIYHNTVKFTPSSKTVTIQENGGPKANVTQVQAEGNNVFYELITPTTAYYIEEETGVIRTTRNLDLEQTPNLVQSVLLIRAYNRFHRNDSAIITVSITVQDVNEMPPMCSPAVFVTKVPETTPIGSKLASFSCTDLDISNSSFNYLIVPNANSRYSFQMKDSHLQVNTTLTYDSEEIASVNFQYAATIVVTDNGTPPVTTNIPVFVTVTPVNQYNPQCNPATQSFTVDENAPLLSVIGQMNATDRDYKFNNVEFSIAGGNNEIPTLFYINPRSGEVHLLSPLDYETKKSYQLRIQVVDLNNDILPDPINQKTNTCLLTINVKDVNDNPPECKPPYYETTVYSTLKTTVPIPVDILCFDKDDNNRFSYSIVGGNINNRFNMAGASIFHSAFDYTREGLLDPTTFELLIQVTDNPAPQHSTTVTVVIHVIPWTTTVATTTEKTTIQTRQPIIVTLTEQYWEPDPWFVAALTVTGILLLALLAFLMWKILSRLCLRAPKESSQPLLQNKSLADIEAPKENQMAKQQQQNMEKKDPIPVSPLSLQFDGRAQDPVSGREYLFNSRTGERRWI